MCLMKDDVFSGFSVLPRRESGLPFILLTRLHVISRTTGLVTEDWITQGYYYRILTPMISCLISTLAACCMVSPRRVPCVVRLGYTQIRLI
jgi:hypothetical protein